MGDWIGVLSEYFSSTSFEKQKIGKISSISTKKVYVSRQKSSSKIKASFFLDKFPEKNSPLKIRQTIRLQNVSISSEISLLKSKMSLLIFQNLCNTMDPNYDLGLDQNNFSFSVKLNSIVIKKNGNIIIYL